MQKNFILKFALFAINIGIITANVCESSDWTLYNGHCYKIFGKAYGNTRLGLEAQEACITEGANLLKIDDDNEYNWMKTFIAANGYYAANIWIGGYAEYYMNFYWLSDGTPISNTSTWWCKNLGDPNNIGGVSPYYVKEKCITTYTATSCITTAPCSWRSYFWCEKPSVASTTTPMPTTCSEGWLSYNGHCYQVFKTPYLNAFDAAKSCSDKGGYLMAINSDDEYKWAVSTAWKTFYLNTLNSYMWLGGYSMYPYEYFWYDYETGETETLSRYSTWWYTTWGADNSGGDSAFVAQNCIRTFLAGFDTAGLDDLACGIAGPYICERNAQ